MSAIENLHNRIDLVNIPFTERGSRLMLFRNGTTLSVRLAERWEKWQGKLGHYRQRPPIVTIKMLDAAGEVLPFELESYPHIVRLLTSVGVFEWGFSDPEALYVRLPAGNCGFEFNVLAETGQIQRRGGSLKGVRNVAYTSSARIHKNEMSMLSEGNFQIRVIMEANGSNTLLLNITPRLAFNHSVPDPDTETAAARERWEQWFKRTPPVLDIYQAQYDYAWWVMRAGLLSQRFYFTREALAPSKIHYVGVWQWDQFFHALAYRHVDMRLAEDQIRIVLDHQRADGMLPDAVHDEGLVTHLTFPVEADVTKPPLVAWTVLKLFEISKHYDFLEEVYEALVRWHGWWERNNSADNGLCYYQHPFSSGLDDSPLWDMGMPVIAPDLNTYLCIQKESLAKIADKIGYPDEAARFRDDAVKMTQAMIDHMWDERYGMFMAKLNGETIPVVTPFSLLPLWTGKLPEALTQRLLNHLTDPKTFWTAYPLPTVSIADPKFDPMQMWRGPTWVNINYLFVEALNRVGQHDLARQLRRKTLDLVMMHKDIYEYYNPLTGERPPKAAPIFGWTSAVFIDLALQETHASRG